MDSSIIIPVTLWGGSQTTFRISSLCVTSNFENLVTGHHEGHICIWDLNIEGKEIVLRTILMGHEYSVTCLVSTNEIVTSCCEGGKMCRWNIEDGYCNKSKRSMYVHRNIQLLKRTSEDEFLFTCGDYTDIVVYHSVTLEIICKLYSNDCTWITNFHAYLKPCSNVIVSGVTAKGCLKTWEISDRLTKSKSEISCSNLPTDDVVDLKYNCVKTLLLIVTSKYWCLFDSELLNCIYKVHCVGDEKLLTGNFCKEQSVIIGTNSGKFYIYDGEHLTNILMDKFSKKCIYKPAIAFGDIKGKQYFLKSNCYGQLDVWSLNYSNEGSDIKLFFSAPLSDNWIAIKSSFFDNVIQFTTVTCCIFSFQLDKFFLGCVNGKIFILPAMQSIMAFYFSSNINKPLYDILSGHEGKINCLLYPRAKYPHYNKAYLVSGGNDFTVCLWDISKLELLHKFCVHSGEIVRLIVPPDDCYNQVRHSICSISSDHSVAILNLLDRRCIILTRSHLFPVVSINWRPFDGFLIVECFDGSIYVWEIETGLLDRIISGVEAQEVLFACREGNICDTNLLNFYISEEVCKKNSMKRELYHTQPNTELENFPISLDRFLINNNAECQIFVCNLELLIKIITARNDGHEEGGWCEKLYLLTQVLNSELPKKPYMFLEKIKPLSGKFERNGKITKLHLNGEAEIKREPKSPICSFPPSSDYIWNILRFLLSSLHIWELDPNLDQILVTHLGLLKPDIALPLGVVSEPGTYSLFLPTSDGKRHRVSSSLVASTCILMTVLSKIIKSPSALNFFAFTETKVNVEKDPWDELYSFYERLCLNTNDETRIPKPKFEVLAKSWQSECLPLRNTVRKLLPSHLESLMEQDYVNLLKFWYQYLPHFKICGKTFEKSDFDNIDFKTIALVLFGMAGSDLKFKLNLSCQDNYIYQTCSSFVYLLLQPKEAERRLSKLQSIAIDFVGRGYIVWEQFLKVEKIFPILFKICRNAMKCGLKHEDTSFESLDKCVSAHDALKAIALARTSAFIKCLTNEISLISTLTVNRSEGFELENSKPEVLSIIVFLLQKTPYIMLLYLNEVISVCTYCIHSSHLKQCNLSSLLPVIKKFRQVHHSVVGQKIAVGLGTGSIAVHDLKSGKVLLTHAHKDSVSALKFSDDGRFLASYCCYENRFSFWQVLTGMFGLGPIQLKLVNSYQTNQIRDEEIRNHLEIGQLIWMDNKSVVLKLCDGTENIFHT